MSNDFSILVNNFKKLKAMVNNHIGNVDGHPLASATHAGFSSVADKKNAVFMGNRALGFPTGVTSVNNLPFGLFFGSAKLLSDMPTNLSSDNSIITIIGWGSLELTSSGDMVSGSNSYVNKKISVVNGLDEYVRYFSSGGTYSTPWKKINT